MKRLSSMWFIRLLMASGPSARGASEMIPSLLHGLVSSPFQCHDPTEYTSVPGHLPIYNADPLATKEYGCSFVSPGLTLISKAYHFCCQDPHTRWLSPTGCSFDLAGDYKCRVGKARNAGIQLVPNTDADEAPQSSTAPYLPDQVFALTVRKGRVQILSVRGNIAIRSRVPFLLFGLYFEATLKERQDGVSMRSHPTAGLGHRKSALSTSKRAQGIAADVESFSKKIRRLHSNRDRISITTSDNEKISQAVEVPHPTKPRSTFYFHEIAWWNSTHVRKIGIENVCRTRNSREW